MTFLRLIRKELIMMVSEVIHDFLHWYDCIETFKMTPILIKLNLVSPAALAIDIRWTGSRRSSGWWSWRWQRIPKLKYPWKCHIWSNIFQNWVMWLKNKKVTVKTSQNSVAKFYITGPLSIKNSFLSYSEYRIHFTLFGFICQFTFLTTGFLKSQG